MSGASGEKPPDLKAAILVASGIVGISREVKAGKSLEEAIAEVLRRGASRPLVWRRAPEYAGAASEALGLGWLNAIGGVRGVAEARIEMPLPQAEALGDDFASTYQSLSRAEGVGSVIVDPFPGAAYTGRLGWRWPLTLGAWDDEGIRSISAELDDWSRLVSRVERISAERPFANVLVIKARDVPRLIKQGVRADFVICLVDDWAKKPVTSYTDILSASGAAGVAIVPAAVPTAQLYDSVLYQLSANEPIANAVARATGNKALVIGDAAALERCRLSYVTELTSRRVRARMDVGLSGIRPPGWESATYGNATPLDRIDLDQFNSDLLTNSEPRAAGVKAAERITEAGEATDSNPPSRWLQASILAKGGDGGFSRLPRLNPKQDFLISVHIGAPGADAVADAPFPYHDVEFAGGYAEIGVSFRILGKYGAVSPECVRLVVNSARDGDVLRGVKLSEAAVSTACTTIKLPDVGDSSPAIFCISGLEEGVWVAAITVDQRGRALQSAELEFVVGGGALQEPVLKITATPHHRFDDLERRRAFGGFVEVRRDGNTLDVLFVWTGASGNRCAADITTSDLHQQLEQFDESMQFLNREGSGALDFTDPAVVEGLSLVAENGSVLWQELTVRLGEKLRRTTGSADEVAAKEVKALSGCERLQCVSHRDAFFPIEFVYDGAPPEQAEEICGAWDPKTVACGCDARTNKKKICPSLFWGARKIIERHCSLESAPQFKGVSPTMKTFPRIRAANFGISNRAVVNAAGEAALKVVGRALKRIVAAGVDCVLTWEDWDAAVKAREPQLLVLAPHVTDKPSDRLWIGDDRYRPKASAGSEMIGAPNVPQLLLLMGCGAAQAQNSFGRFPEWFIGKGADAVVAPLAPIHGPHALAIAAHVIDEIADRLHAPGPLPFTFGELVRSARARAVKDGYLIALSAASFGDTDWVFE
jgi:hypothetical protein